jgi:hypothetical protein
MKDILLIVIREGHFAALRIYSVLHIIIYYVENLNISSPNLLEYVWGYLPFNHKY